VAITDLNPKYVWGGDAITLNNADMVWIDHVTVSHCTHSMLCFLPCCVSDMDYQ
jgi:pectin lyase